MQKKRLLENSKLYIILDENICFTSKNILKIVKQIDKNSINIIQLRYKKDSIKDFINISMELSPIIKQKKALFIINDRPDVAFACNADGIHLGQDDIPPKIARRLLGRGKIIGLSCHNLKQALKAQNDPNVDYLSIGPIFTTALKPQYKPIGLKIISKVTKQIAKPFFAIGGINLNNLSDVLHYGAKRVSLCRDICRSNNIRERTKLIKERLQYS